MASFLQNSDLAVKCLQDQCEGFSGEYWLSRVFYGMLYSPVFITFIMFVAGIWYQELYLAMIGVGITLSWLLNWGFLVALSSTHSSVIEVDVWNDGSSEWVKAERHRCLDGFEMPSSIAQQVAFFVVAAFVYHLVTQKPASFYLISIIQAGMVMAIYAPLYLNFSTIGDVLVGVVLGAFFAILYSVFLNYFLYRYGDEICHWWPIRMLGIRAKYLSVYMDRVRKKAIHRQLCGNLLKMARETLGAPQLTIEQFRMLIETLDSEYYLIQTNGDAGSFPETGVGPHSS